MKPTPLILFGIILSSAGTLVWFINAREPLPEGLIQVNGRIEGDRYTVAGKIGGKIVALQAREGDAVEEGQVLVRLDSDQMRAKVDQARAALEALKARRAGARLALETLKKQIPIQIATAEAAVAHREASLVAAKARLDQAARDSDRFQRLLKNRTVDQESAEQKLLAWTLAQAEHRAAETGLTQARKQLAESQLGWEKIAVKTQEVAALDAQVRQAQAALAEAESRLADLTIRAPARGVITTRIVDRGEVVAAGSPLFDLVDLDRLYLKAYLPERAIGKVRLGLPARIHTDAFPQKPFPARVRFIAAQAEFTPKEVQTPDERVKLVYEIRLYLDGNPDHRLTPGLPADAIIRWREGVPWAEPRW